MRELTPIPPGYREIRIKRRGGHPNGDFVGRQHPENRFLEVRSRSDGELHPVDKAELLPEGAWMLMEGIFEAARVTEQPVKEVIRFLNDGIQGDPEFPLLSLLQHAIQHNPSHGHSRPDPSGDLSDAAGPDPSH